MVQDFKPAQSIIPGTEPKFVAKLLSELAGPLSSRVIYRTQALLNAEQQKIIDALTGNGFKVKTIQSPKPFAEGFKVDKIQREPLTNFKSPVANTVIGPLTLQKGEYKTFGYDGKVQTVTMLRDFTLPFTTLATYSRSKIAAITDLRAQRGSVKELFGFSDWRIAFRGLILADDMKGYTNNSFPLLKAQEFMLWEEITDAVAINGDMPAMLGISKVYLQSIEINEVEGKPNVLVFKIDALSDKQVEIDIRP